MQDQSGDRIIDFTLGQQKITAKEMALSALKDKWKPHELKLQISPPGGAVSAKPREPGKTCNRLQILHKAKIHF